jgi:N6-adenosine-specific RNA methylase IME4
MATWGFRYQSNFVWDKEVIGTGYWNRNRHEHLLIGTRGSIPAPAQGEQCESLIRTKRTVHCAKPACFRAMIEKMYPTLPKLEMFARERIEGWDPWGNEVI